MQYFVIPSTPEKVVLRIYGDNLICSEFDREAKTLKSEFSVYKVPGSQVQNLRLETLGPLKVEKTKQIIPN